MNSLTPFFRKSSIRKIFNVVDYICPFTTYEENTVYNKWLIDNNIIADANSVSEFLKTEEYRMVSSYMIMKQNTYS